MTEIGILYKAKHRAIAEALSIAETSQVPVTSALGVADGVHNRLEMALRTQEEENQDQD